MITESSLIKFLLKENLHWDLEKYYFNNNASINANWDKPNKINQDYSSSLVIFWAIQKITWFFQYLYLFLNKILIERELVLRFRKIDKYI